jgi:protein-S-isoprenylcysteine O-methyltransferase Ste14
MDMLNGLWISLVFTGFAILHSLSAGTGLKTRLGRLMPERTVEGWYRLGYNVLSVITFIPVLIVMFILPDRPLYAVNLGWALLLRVVQLAGAIGLIWTLLSIDILRFAGISQAWSFIQAQRLPLPDEPLQQTGIYSFTRHPLYVFSLIALWASPSMTVNAFIFNICATFYFVVGSLIEERRLTQIFGEQYRQYRMQVPWIGVRLHRPKGSDRP